MRPEAGFGFLVKHTTYIHIHIIYMIFVILIISFILIMDITIKSKWLRFHIITSLYSIQITNRASRSSRVFAGWVLWRGTQSNIVGSKECGIRSRSLANLTNISCKFLQLLVLTAIESKCTPAATQRV